jgi:hypothetical protein
LSKKLIQQIFWVSLWLMKTKDSEILQQSVLSIEILRILFKKSWCL